MKPDVKTEPQRRHWSVSYPQHRRSSKSKQRHKKLGWKISFLKQGSDSPTFLTAQTRQANPSPGRLDPPHFTVQSKSQPKASCGGGTLQQTQPRYKCMSERYLPLHPLYQLAFFRRSAFHIWKHKAKGYYSQLLFRSQTHLFLDTKIF